MSKGTSSFSPVSRVSDDQLDELADFLDDRSPIDLDGLFGVLHAVAVAPGMVPPSAWIPLIFSNLAAEDSVRASRSIEYALGLYNEVLGAINDGTTIVPEPDDVAGCESFALGFAAGAALDSVWVADDAHWTFASCFAYLGGSLDLVPAETLAKFDAMPDTREMLRRQLGGIVIAASDAFQKVRRAGLSGAPAVARKAPCPCGSGKKYKRCCGADERST